MFGIYININQSIEKYIDIIYCNWSSVNNVNK